VRAEEKWIKKKIISPEQYQKALEYQKSHPAKKICRYIAGFWIYIEKRVFGTYF